MGRMDNTSIEVHFEELNLPRRQVPELMGGRYFVYSSPTEYQLVDAGSALEAIQKSGLKEVYRLQRDMIFLHSVIDLPWEEKTQAEAAPVDAAPALPEKPQLPDFNEVAVDGGNEGGLPS